jgi:hypothetical protein
MRWIFLTMMLMPLVLCTGCTNVMNAILSPLDQFRSAPAMKTGMQPRDDDGFMTRERSVPGTKSHFGVLEKPDDDDQ